MWAASSPSLAHLATGAADADSWATDAHKWLNVPYDSGLAFVRRSEFLGRAMTIAAAYIPKGARRDPGQFTPELSRRARGVEIWAALRSLGKAGRNRWLGKRPRVRGVAMNPVDHPNGGGQGKSKGGGGRQHLVSPWGQLAKGFPTRKRTKLSSSFILVRANGRPPRGKK